MGKDSMTPSAQRLLAELQERWPDMEITHHWFGFLAYPKGTDPVVVATFAEGIDRQPARYRDEKSCEPGTAVVVVDSGEDEPGFRRSCLPIDGS